MEYAQKSHHFCDDFSSFLSLSDLIADSHPHSKAAGGRRTQTEIDSPCWWRPQLNRPQHRRRTAGSIRQP